MARLGLRNVAPFRVATAIQGYNPWSTSYDHPAGQITPNKAKVSILGLPKAKKK